jgi:ParB-like chromosome segregation protein Spo0J
MSEATVGRREESESSDFPTQIQYLPPDRLVEHEEARRIPEMSTEEWTDFIESVCTRRVVTDAVYALPDGRVFDGRHRLRAANELGLRLIPVIFYAISEDEVIQRMSDSAVLRRSLSPGQRAAIVLEFAQLGEKLRETAREHSRANLKRGREIPDSPDLGGRELKGKVTAQLAEKAGIGRSSMEMLASVQRDEPELFAEVKAGNKTISAAYTETKRRKQAESEPPIIEDMPKRTGAKKSRLDEIKRESESDPAIPQIEDESSLSEDNIIRYRAERDLNDYAVRLVVDYEALKGATRESVDLYIYKLKRVIEGSLLIISEFDKNDHVRELAEQTALFICQSRTEEGQILINQTLGGVVNGTK